LTQQPSLINPSFWHC